MHKRDLTGLKFNMLTVESFAYIRDSHAYWNCVCDCGKKTVVCGSRLMRNTTKSCGCLGPKMTRQRAKREGFSTYSRKIKERLVIGKSNDQPQDELEEYSVWI